MSVEKYYPNFTDEELEIGWLSDLAKVTPYLLSGGAMPWARSQKSILSPWQTGRTPFVSMEENSVPGTGWGKAGQMVLSPLSDFDSPPVRLEGVDSHGLFSFSLLCQPCQLNLPAQNLWLERSGQFQLQNFQEA